MRVDTTWVFRVVWATLPLAAGPALADALDPRSQAVRTVASVALWLGWAAVLAASLVPSTVSLTIIRVLAPAAPLATAWAALDRPSAATGAVTVATVVALVATSVAAVVVMDARIGDRFVDGSSYGPERRLALRVPAPVLLGPLELTWAASLAGALAGPLLLASRQWVAGGIATAVGLVVVFWAVRSLHALSRRWLVFVPGGMVLHDPLTVTESVLMPRAMIERLGPAPADSSAYDLTQRAAGLALEATLREPLPVSLYRPRARQPETATVEQVLFTPTRPAAALDAAAERRIPVG